MTVFNATSTSCAHARTAWAAQGTGGPSFRLMAAGDSITAGYNDTAGSHDLLTAGWPSRLLAKLNGNIGAWDYGYEYTTQIDAAYPDPDRTFSGDWAVGNDGTNVAQYGYIAGKATTGEFAFGPVVCDSFKLHVRNNTAGSFQYKIDSGSWSATQAVTSTPFTIAAGTAGPHTLHIRSMDAANFTVIMAIEWTDSTRTYAKFAHTGRFGAQVVQWSSSTDSLYVGFSWCPMPPPPDLLIMFIGTNDQGNGVAEATTLANLTTIIDAARGASKDVLLVIPPPIGPTNTLPTSSYRSSLFSLATSKDVPLLDLQARWGTTYSAAVAAGFLSGTDNAHPTPTGHADIAQAFYDGLATILNVTPPAPATTWSKEITEKWDGAAWTKQVMEKWNGSAWVPVIAEKAT